MTATDSIGRRLLRSTALLVGVAGLAWSLLLLITGGFDASIVGRKISAHNQFRPLLVAGIALTMHIVLGGDVDSFLRRAEVLTRVDGPLSRLRPPDWLLVSVLAMSVCAIGFVYGSKVAGGSDSWGYVSQAELWLNGNLLVDQSFVKEVPWPRAKDTFTPLGYRPGGGPQNEWSLVPTYSPGLPLLFAAAKRLGGQTAMFVVVPLLGGLLVVATYGIGRRVASSAAGLMGAWLVATSPAVLDFVVVAMTDVPVAALWAAAFYCGLGVTGGSALGAGLLTGAAVTVRPNLVPLAAVLGVRYVFEFFGRSTWRRAIVRGLAFSAGVVPFIAFVAVLNARLYGSPFTSGYGTIDSMFTASNAWQNLRNYLTWLVESQTSVALIGLVAVFIPARRLWPAARGRSEVVLMALIVAVVWLEYVCYLVFGAWWYLRFLLTSWPFIMLGIGAVVVWLMRSSWLAQSLLLLFVVGLGLLQFWQAWTYGTFENWAGERRSITAAQMARRLTDSNSVIVSMQHSGSVRYYGGRMTLRYDQMEAAWIDRAIDWLTSRGAHTYLLAEEWEMTEFDRLFAGTRAAAALQRPPVAVYDEPGHLFLFDLSVPRERSQQPEHVTGVSSALSAVAPAPPPRLVFRQ